MKSSVLCKRLTGLRLLFIILRSASHVSQIPQPTNQPRMKMTMKTKLTSCCSWSRRSPWSLWRTGCDRSWAEWSFRSGKQSHQWIHSPARETKMSENWIVQSGMSDHGLSENGPSENGRLPWKRKSWRWNRGVVGCRWLWPGESVAGTCASSWQWSGGVKWVRKILLLAGKQQNQAAELVNLVRPWAPNNPPHCKHKNLFVKEFGHKIPKSQLN